jgi:hypothetical protein
MYRIWEMGELIHDCAKALRLCERPPVGKGFTLGVVVGGSGSGSGSGMRWHCAVVGGGELCLWVGEMKLVLLLMLRIVSDVIAGHEGRSGIGARHGSVG